MFFLFAKQNTVLKHSNRLQPPNTIYIDKYLFLSWFEAVMRDFVEFCLSNFTEHGHETFLYVPEQVCGAD